MGAVGGIVSAVNYPLTGLLIGIGGGALAGGIMGDPPFRRLKNYVIGGTLAIIPYASTMVSYSIGLSKNEEIESDLESTKFLDGIEDNRSVSYKPITLEEFEKRIEEYDR